MASASVFLVRSRQRPDGARAPQELAVGLESVGLPPHLLELRREILGRSFSGASNRSSNAG